jgi:hypothetical protein
MISEKVTVNLSKWTPIISQSPLQPRMICLSYKPLGPPHDSSRARIVGDCECDAVPAQVCSRADSHHFRKLLAQSISPLTELQSAYESEIPIFDDKFLRDLDNFSVLDPIATSDVLGFLWDGPDTNFTRFSGQFSIPCFVRDLPHSFAVVTSLLERCGPVFHQHFLANDGIGAIGHFIGSDSEFVARCLLSVSRSGSEDGRIIEICRALFELEIRDVDETISVILGELPVSPEIVGLVLNMLKRIEDEGTMGNLLRVLTNFGTVEHIENLIPVVQEHIGRFLGTENRSLQSEICNFLDSVADFGLAEIVGTGAIDLFIGWAQGESSFLVKERAVLLLCQIVNKISTWDMAVLNQHPIVECLTSFLYTNCQELHEVIQALDFAVSCLDDANQALEILQEAEDVICDLCNHHNLIVAHSASHLLAFMREGALL